MRARGRAKGGGGLRDFDAQEGLTGQRRCLGIDRSEIDRLCAAL